MFAENLLLQENDALPRATKPPFLSELHAKNDTTNLFGYKLGQLIENKKSLLFFTGKETIQTFFETVLFEPLRCCLRSDKLVNCHV